MSDRTFTLDEAQMLLPILESLLKQAINSKKLIEDVDNELQETAHRVFLNGGTMLNVVHLARPRPSAKRRFAASKTPSPKSTPPACRSKISISDCWISPAK